ncbi:MAG: rhomboid family intramembrane serine protease, partial [Phycisphaerales bacterium]
MGIADRDYIRTKRRGYDGPGGPTGLGVSGWSFTVWLIVVNIGVFVLDKMVFRTSGIIERIGHFSTAKAFFFQTPTGQIIFGLEFWRFITFQFLHANFLHIFFNMLALWIFGPLVESRMGFKRYAAFYLVCGVFGAIMYLVLNLTATLLGPGANIPGLLFNDPHMPLVGASAGVFGVLMAAAYYRPNDQVVLLFPPIPIRLKYLAYGYVGIAALSLLFGSPNAGGEAAHLGGAIAGFFFVRNSHLLHDFFDVFGKSPPP